MAPINRLTSLVLLAAVSADMAAATTGSPDIRRKLVDGETEFSVTADGHTFDVEFDGDTEVIATEDTALTVEDGLVKIVQIGDDFYSATYDEESGDLTGLTPLSSSPSRRTEQVDFADRRLQTSCEDICAAGSNQLCGALNLLCAFSFLLPPEVDDLCTAVPDLCSLAGILASCDRTCAPPCDDDDDCTEPNEVCCPAFNICEVPDITGACGDPHMTGFLGQKFDFTGEDGAWYCLVNDGPSMHLNMRITSPVPSVPQITYITGLSMVTTDVQGNDHTIEISVNDPHNLDSACPEGVSPCLADGALSVKLDGQKALTSPGEVTLGPGVAISAVNLPGACRSFGFEKYWERKKLQNAGGGRRLDMVGFMQDMGEWILADPTATNMNECAEYVAAAGNAGLFEHESEHALFQIMTPAGTIRLSHGRLHQLAMRDPTDQFDLPDHLTWQMNVAIDHHDVSLEATGVLGETVVPTVDGDGKLIMNGIHAIRGAQEDYRVQGPLEKTFARGLHQ